MLPRSDIERGEGQVSLEELQADLRQLEQFIDEQIFEPQVLTSLKHSLVKVILDAS